MSCSARCLTEELDQERPWEAHAWLRAETLAALAELNEQCLEMLAHAVCASPALAASVAARSREWVRCCEHGPGRAPSRCGVSLSAFRCGVRGPAAVERGCRATACGTSRGRMDRRSSPCSRRARMARLVFTYAWHLARSQNAAARLLLGMSAHCARLIAVCTLRQIHDLAEMHPEWLQPRWATRPQFWRELLLSATSGRCRRHGTGADARAAAHGGGEPGVLLGGTRPPSGSSVGSEIM